MKNLCIIPARGGSKRIPNKNIKDFLGKPIIAYSIETALQSGLFDEVMVSTDSEEIAEVARKYGAKVPFMRSAETASDTAGTAEVILEVYQLYKDQGSNPVNICCFYPTAPFVTKKILQEAYNKLTTGGFDCVFPVTAFEYPIQRAIIMKGDKISLREPENINKRSQDLEPAYHDVGQFYWLKPERTINKKLIWTENTSVVKISPLAAQDIDHETDWQLAELKYSHFFKGS